MAAPAPRSEIVARLAGARDPVDLGQKFIATGNVGHAVALVAVTDDAGFVDDKLHRHASQFQQPHRLLVLLGRNVFGIGQARKRHALLLPIGAESLLAVRSQVQKNNPAFNEACILIAQLREVPAAKGSAETAVKDQDHCFAPVSGQTVFDAVGIGQGKVGGPIALLRGCHSKLVAHVQGTSQSKRHIDQRLQHIDQRLQHIDQRLQQRCGSFSAPSYLPIATVTSPPLISRA